MAHFSIPESEAWQTKNYQPFFTEKSACIKQTLLSSGESIRTTDLRVMRHDSRVNHPSRLFYNAINYSEFYLFYNV